MSRFAVVALVLLTAVMAAGAAAWLYGGGFPGFGILEAAGKPASADSASQQQADRAAAAIRGHDAAAVRQFLAEGGDPDAADGEGEILLNRAVLHGTPEILDLLLAAGADPDLPGKNGLGPLTIAALSGRQAMLERLMRANSEEPAHFATAGPVRAGPSAAAMQAAPASISGSAVTAEASAPSTGPGAAPMPSAAFAGDGEMPAEPYASMAGLSIRPIARPLPGTPAAAAFPASGATEAAAQPPVAAAPATAAAAPTVGNAPQSWASAAQRRLTQLGYYKGPVTGFAGPLTADAVKRYQAVAGLPQDGVISADLLRRIGAVVGGPEEAPTPAAAPAPDANASAAAAPAPSATAATAATLAADPAQSASRGLQQVRNALGREFNSATRPDALRQHCQANANAWVYDEAIGRSLYCRDVVGSPPR